MAPQVWPFQTDEHTAERKWCLQLFFYDLCDNTQLERQEGPKTVVVPPQRWKKLQAPCEKCARSTCRAHLLNINQPCTTHAHVEPLAFRNVDDSTLRQNVPKPNSWAWFRRKKDCSRIFPQKMSRAKWHDNASPAQCVCSCLEIAARRGRYPRPCSKRCALSRLSKAVPDLTIFPLHVVHHSLRHSVQIMPGRRTVATINAPLLDPSLTSWCFHRPKEATFCMSQQSVTRPSVQACIPRCLTPILAIFPRHSCFLALSDLVLLPPWPVQSLCRSLPHTWRCHTPIFAPTCRSWLRWVQPRGKKAISILSVLNSFQPRSDPQPRTT